jgi:hypothetical protein
MVSNIIDNFVFNTPSDESSTVRQSYEFHLVCPELCIHNFFTLDRNGSNNFLLYPSKTRFICAMYTKYFSIIQSGTLQFVLFGIIRDEPLEISK